MALAFALRLEREATTPKTRVERAFLLAFHRLPESKELQLALTHLDKQTRYHQSTPPLAKPVRKLLIHTITSELTGEKSQFIQPDNPPSYEEHVQPRDVSPQTRALAGLTLVLLNASEFIYIY